MLVEREVRHQPFQSAVFFLQLPEPAECTHAEVGILLLPGIEGLLGDAELPTDIPERGARLGLAESLGDLLFRES